MKRIIALLLAVAAIMFPTTSAMATAASPPPDPSAVQRAQAAAYVATMGGNAQAVVFTKEDNRVRVAATVEDTRRDGATVALEMKIKGAWRPILADRLDNKPTSNLVDVDLAPTEVDGKLVMRMIIRKNTPLVFHVGSWKLDPSGATLMERSVCELTGHAQDRRCLNYKAGGRGKPTFLPLQEEAVKPKPGAGNKSAPKKGRSPQPL